MAVHMLKIWPEYFNDAKRTATNQSPLMAIAERSDMDTDKLIKRAQDYLDANPCFNGDYPVAEKILRDLANLAEPAVDVDAAYNGPYSTSREAFEAGWNARGDAPAVDAGKVNIDDILQFLPVYEIGFSKDEWVKKADVRQSFNKALSAIMPVAPVAGECIRGGRECMWLADQQTRSSPAGDYPCQGCNMDRYESKPVAGKEG